MVFERHAAIQRVAENKFERNTMSLVHLTGHKRVNEGTAKHEQEVEKHTSEVKLSFSTWVA